MSLNTVTITCDVYTGTGMLNDQSFAYFTPSSSLTDTSDMHFIGNGSIGVQFINPPVSVTILATDNSSISPSGWSWQFAGGLDPKFIGGPTPPPISFFLPAGPAAFTATNATPCVFTWTATVALTSLPNDTGIQLSGGSLPAGFSAATTYYVVSSSGSTFSLAATKGGGAIASTSSGSGNLTVVSTYLSTLIASSW